MSFIFDANEDPKERELRKNRAIMGALYSGATKPPTDLGSGLASIGSALAYRSMMQKQKAAAADPWTGMRKPTGQNMFAPLPGFIRGLFG